MTVILILLLGINAAGEKERFLSFHHTESETKKIALIRHSLCESVTVRGHHFSLSFLSL